MNSARKRFEPIGAVGFSLAMSRVHGDSLSHQLESVIASCSLIHGEENQRSGLPFSPV
jgi:hypothetical protein